jgi:2-polyprenyl-3-methyl-5-hydroxy-6-metoxy-1,4-benzoquinol methylase
VARFGLSVVAIMSYENYERAQGWDPESFGGFSAAQDDHYGAQLGSLGFAPSKPLRVLDIGFGNGAFLGWSRAQGWECEGIEVNARLIERGSRSGFTVSGSLGGLKESPHWKPYDLITAFDVLEHIDRETMVAFLSSLHDVCHAQTLILLRFPNGDNPFSLPVQNGDVTHRTAIGQGLLRQVAELAELDVTSLGGPQQSSRSAPLKRRLAAAAGAPLRWVLGEFFRHLFMGSMDVVFTGNLVAVLRSRRPSGIAAKGPPRIA